MCKNLFTYCALMLLLALAPLSAMAQQGPGAGPFREAEQARRAGQLDQAITLYQKAIDAEGTNYKYYARMGMVYAQQRKNKEAKKAFEDAVRINPSFTSGLLFIAKMAMKEGDNATALTYINRAFDAEQDQGKKLTYKLLAVKLLIKSNKPQDAQAELQKAKAIAPNDIRVATAEGDVQTALGNYQGALAAYESALSRLPSGSSPADKGKVLLGLCVAKYKGGDQAGANAKATAELGPLGGSFLRQYKFLTGGGASLKFLTLASGYLKANMFTEAMENVNKAIEAGDKNNTSYKVQALIYLKQGQMQQAIAAFDKAATAETDAAKKGGIYKTMVKLQFGAQMYREAVATADKVLAATTDAPTKSSINLMKAQALYQLGQYQAAIDAAKMGMVTVAGEPQQAVYQFVIGMAAKKAGDVATARAAFEKAASGSFKYAAKQEASSLGGATPR